MTAIPYDPQAEAEVVGNAVRTDKGFRIAAAVVTPGDFYTPKFARLFAASAELGDVPHGWDSSERIRLAAAAADVDEAEVRALVFDGSRFHDVHGEFAHRVAEVARRRRAMAAAAEVFNALGDGAAVEDALAHLQPFLRESPWAA